MRSINFDFVGKRKIWYAISIIIILLGLISLITRGLNLGIDFTGGNIIQVHLEQTIDVEELRDLVSTHVEATPSIQVGEDNDYLIRTTDMDEEESNQLISEIQERFGQTEVLRNEHIGPVIGDELISNAKWALILALVLMLIYITIRFKFKFAVSAIIPLIHDVLVTVGLFSILQVEVDSTFIAAILTILGYSINGTIVIFDRIRENMGNNKQIDSFKDLVNNSINQTLGRSVNTVIAVLILVVCLFLFGGETIKAFSLALLIGFCAGAYSSVFIAGSILTGLFGANEKKKLVAATNSKSKK